ncbi:DNA-binding protein RFX5 [Elgaria multicarinata webbii]|uniref:DNA-binding protein RFX5 n=1 Tax=Elgaria multicarinata webbii TaxID=159646 RepID=UPI002FCD38F5
MAEDNELFVKLVENGGETLEAEAQGSPTEPSTLLQKLKGAISKSVQSKVDCILQVVQRFSDHAKLYLYLQLPSGPSSAEKNLDLTSLGSVEHMHACTWIRNHLEEYPDTCLPKQDVYDAYKQYCDDLCRRSLSAANFGKIIREIFPNIKARRLGGRGQSKYCYSGIRRKTVVHMPPLPSLDLKETETPERVEVVQSYNDEVMDAACALTCDWAEKILKRSFNNILEVAQFLIQQHIISSRSAHADLVMAMVVSETAESHREKRAPQTAKKVEPETPENTSKTQPPAKTENAPKPMAAAPRSEAKKATDAPAKPASRPQVNALVARLPLLLPRVRVQPGDRLVVAPGAAAMHASPPVLAPKLTPAPIGGTVKMALSVSPASSALLAPAVNAPPGLVGQQGAVPVINMMPVINVAMPPRAEIPPKFKSLPSAGGVNGCEAGRSPCEPQKAKAPSKRPADTSEEATVRRKRGRPRKKLDEPEPPSSEKKTAEERSTKPEADSDIIVVTVGYEDRAASSSSYRRAQEEKPEVDALRVGEAVRPPLQGPSGEGPARPNSLIVSPSAKATVQPSQVSVIKGRKPSPPILAKETGSDSQEPLRLAQGAPVPGSSAPASTARDSDEPGRCSSSDSELQPTDLSLGKLRPPFPKDCSDAANLRASSVRLHRISSDQGKATETASHPSTQAPSR